MKKIIPLILAGMVAALAAFLLFSDDKPAAPVFSLTDLSGSPVDSAQMANHIVLLNFWYPSCPGCDAEMPKIVKLQQDFVGKPFSVIGIAMPYDSEETVRHYVERQNVRLAAVAYDADRRVSDAFGVQLAPTSVLIDQNGKIVRRFVGEPDFPQLYSQIEQMLQNLH